MIDWTSIKFYSLTILGGFFSVTTKSEFIFWITIMVGISTFIYNGIKIYKELKK